MTRDALLAAGLAISAYIAIDRARGARMLIRAAQWPTADHQELGKLTRAYIGAAAAYALSATAMLAALAARHA